MKRIMKQIMKSLLAFGMGGVIMLMTGLSVKADYNCDTCGIGMIRCWDETSDWTPTGNYHICHTGIEYEYKAIVYRKEKCDHCGVQYMWQKGTIIEWRYTPNTK